ncbi:MAG: hypothetical protein L6Q98_07965 [Anaerolineae bacterium]|nr:hypothetical protein [Anaerolineae bacterium]NUQ02525.1 hypothetical protein [Anaerolineae bacterium]
MARKFAVDPNKPFFIFDTAGDWHATMLNWYIFDARGDYIGFVRNADYDVFTRSGEWIGNLFPDGRIIRNRNADRPPLLKQLPPVPSKPKLPARAPLPPINGDLGYSRIDVLEWDPEIFKRLSDLVPDAGEE